MTAVKKRSICVVTAVLFAFLLIMPVTASAADGDAGQSAYETAYEAVKENHRCDLARAVFMMKAFASGKFAGSLSEGRFLKIDTESEYWNVYLQWYDVFAGIGAGMAVVWLLLDLLEKIQLEQLSYEVILKMIIRLMCTVYLISHGPDILEKVIEFGNRAAETVGSAASSTLPDYMSMAQEVADMGFFRCLGEMAELIVPALSMIAALILMYVIVVGRMVEIGIRTSFAPLGMADAFSHGLNSPGMRYLKKYAAVCLQGAVLAVILLAGTYIENFVTESAAGIPGFSVIAQPVIMFSMLGLMIKSQTIINDIAGV